MRTTVLLDDHVFREAKRRAATRGVTLSQLVNEALRAALAKTVSPAREYAMATYGDSRRPVHHEPVDFADEAEAEDRARLRK